MYVYVKGVGGNAHCNGMIGLFNPWGEATGLILAKWTLPVPAQFCADRGADDSHKPKYDNEFAENFHGMSCAKVRVSLASLCDKDIDGDAI